MEFKILPEEKIEEIRARTDLIAYSSGFADFCRLQYGAEVFFLQIKEDEGLDVILPIFIREINGLKIAESPLPFYYTEPIFFDEDFKFEPKLISKDLLNFIKADVLEMNFFEFNFSSRINFDGFNREFSAFIFEIANLGSSEETLLATVDKKARNQIRFAEKSGLECKFIEPDVFYGLYGKHRAKFNISAKPEIYFKNLENAFGDQFKLLGVFKDEKLIGANLWVFKGGYLWLINSAFDEDFQSFYPNNFAYWQMIKWGVKNGIKTFDYGGGLLKNKGLTHFKESFGAKARPIYRTRFYKNSISKIKYWFEQKSRHFHQKYER